MTKTIEANAFCKYVKTNVVCFLLLVGLNTYTQNQNSKKTTDIESLPANLSKDALYKTTKDFIANNDYKKAAKIMKKYYNNFSENLEINWLYAHVFWLNNDIKKANKKFLKTYSIAPNNKELHIDYARFLYKNGKIHQLEKFLEKTNNNNSLNIEYLLMQAYANFWKGDLKLSKQKIATIKEIAPGTKITQQIEKEITDITSSYISADFEYQTDSQPLKYFANHITVGEYVSRYFNPELQISRYRFTPQKEGSLIATLNNQFYFDKIKLTANIHGGFYSNHNDKTDWIGGVSLNKKLIKNASIKVGFKKNPVLTTIASTTINLTEDIVYTELNYGNKFFDFNAAFAQSFYDDNNYIQNISSWILSTPLKVRNLSFQFGYSFNFTDSKEVLFVFSDINTGVYDPYFTPKDLEIHSGLFIATYKPTKKLTIESKINYGFVGNVQNPYPFQTSATSVEIGGFYADTFTPIEFTGIVNYDFSDSFSTKITYINQETFFYERENINLGINLKI